MVCIFLRVPITFISSSTWPVISKSSWTVGETEEETQDRQESEAALRSLKSGAELSGRVRILREGSGQEEWVKQRPDPGQVGCPSVDSRDPTRNFTHM